MIGIFKKRRIRKRQARWDAQANAGRSWAGVLPYIADHRFEVIYVCGLRQRARAGDKFFLQQAISAGDQGWQLGPQYGGWIEIHRVEPKTWLVTSVDPSWPPKSGWGRGDHHGEHVLYVHNLQHVVSDSSRAAWQYTQSNLRPVLPH